MAPMPMETVAPRLAPRAGCTAHRGMKCIKDIACGDGVLNGTEECDDGNTDVGDGCSGLCHLEPFSNARCR